MTLLVLRETEVAVPARHEHHVVSEVLPLDLGLLEDDDIRLEDIEHSLDDEEAVRF